jgi:hypothetical protein
MEEIYEALLLLILNILAPVLAIAGVIWGFIMLRSIMRTRKSLAEAKGDPVAMKLERTRLASRLVGFLATLLFVAGLVFAFFVIGSGHSFFEMEDSDLALYAVIGTVVLSGVGGIWAALIRARYNALFKEHFVATELAKVFTNLEYSPRERFGNAELESLNFFSHLDYVNGDDLITAQYKGIRFALCDLLVQEKYTVIVTDKDGEEREETRHRDVFRGRAMRFDFADAFRGVVQVVEKDFSGAGVASDRSWQKIETELAAFNDTFRVFTKDPLNAMSVLTPQMIEGIFFLNKAVPGSLALYYKDHSMHVFLATSRKAFEVSGSKTLLEEKALLQQDIQSITGFLDTMYFKRQA